MRKTNAKVAEWHPFLASSHRDVRPSPMPVLPVATLKALEILPFASNTWAEWKCWSPHGAGSPDPLPVAHLSFRDHPTDGHEEISGRSQHVGCVRRSSAPLHSNMAQQTHSTARLHTRPGPSEVGWYCTTTFDNYVDPCLLQDSMHPVLRVRADIV